ncbi:hypothetical protein N9L40_00985 [Rhodobacteraceae bacterium]|nr:hypothetical protein [Paracoccaceae bacterium]
MIKAKKRRRIAFFVIRAGWPQAQFSLKTVLKSDFADFAGFHALFADLCAAGAKAGGLP